MRKLVSLFVIAVVIPLFLVTGCRKYEEEPQNSYTKLASYLVENDLDLPDLLSQWITPAPTSVADVPAFVEMYDIFDIRQANAFAAGHIEGAKNVLLKDIVTEAATTTKPILVVCYTGQTASHAVIALRLSGYTDAKVLKWGMSGWRSDLSTPWLNNSGTDNGVIGVGHANWSMGPVAEDMTYDAPLLTTTATNGAGILAERVNHMLTNGFKGVASAEVLENPGLYFINNFWAQADVDHYGHITGAHRIKPLSIENGEISKLNPEQQICTYCWTGQTSSMITAFLNVLGYNAVSLKFGANSMIYSELESHKFVVPTVDLPVVQ